MTKISCKNQTGVTLITLAMAIVIMLIISSVLIYSVNTGSMTRKLNDMNNDIKLLQDRVNIYYATYRKLPVIGTTYTQVNHITDKNVNDNQNYYVIDLETLENITLAYGKGFTDYKNGTTTDDVYIINEKSHTIYYPKGVMLDGKTYYTLLNTSTPVELPEVSNIRIKEMVGNRASLTLQVAKKDKGIQEIKVYVGNQLYHTYTYDKENREQKIENITIQPVAFYQEIPIDVELIDLEGNVTKLDTITIVNKDTITTKEDLNYFRDLVNGGNTFQGKVITLAQDIELEGNNAQQWTPIGNSSNKFLGTLDGNSKRISGIYINTATGGKGLFGRNDGIIKNLTLVGTMTIKGTAGGIAADNYNVIENCTNEIIMQNAGVITGGIVGANQQNAVVRRCVNKANVTGQGQDSYSHSFVGGIAGNNNGIVEECYNIATIEGIQTVGGIVGGQYENTLQNCYNIGEVKGTDGIGGVTGFLHFWSGAKKEYSLVKNCYSVGKITATQTNGGIIGTGGDNAKCSYTNNYYLAGTAIGGVNSIDTVGQAEVKTQAELRKMAETLGSSYKKDIQNINQGYPIFSWQ